jgi:hypothetical protein
MQEEVQMKDVSMTRMRLRALKLRLRFFGKDATDKQRLDQLQQCRKLHSPRHLPAPFQPTQQPSSPYPSKLTFPALSNPTINIRTSLSLPQNDKELKLEYTRDSESPMMAEESRDLRRARSMRSAGIGSQVDLIL